MNWSLVDNRKELRFWPNFNWVVLSTLMIAFPASLVYASLLWNASMFPKKLYSRRTCQPKLCPCIVEWSVSSVLDIAVR